MYLDFFQCNQFPFRLTPDSEFLYMSTSHSRANAYMDYTVWNRDGFVVITGDVGSGKTTLTQNLFSHLAENVVVAKLFQTQLNEIEFLQAVLVEFGFNPFNASKVELIDMLNTFLIEQFAQLKQPLLVIDDAHNLSIKVLEEIRMLSGLETQKEKILHVILVGQQELNEKLESPEMEQLFQRIRLRYHIKALSEEDTQNYIEHRLRVAGITKPGLFTSDTISIIHKYTGGIPRLINTLCDTSMICAFADTVRVINSDVMKTAIEELQWIPYAERMDRQVRGRNNFNNSEIHSMLENNTRALVDISKNFNQLDKLGSTLSTMSDKMANIESLLKYIASSLQRKKQDSRSGVLEEDKQ